MRCARTYRWVRMHRHHAVFTEPGIFFAVRSWADCITNMFGFDLRQAQEVLHLGKKHLGFQLDSLREQLSRARSQDIGQGIIDLVGMTKTNNIAILIHGVSLSLRGSGRLDTRLDTPPISLRHHPVSRIAPPSTPAIDVKSLHAKIGE